MKYKLKNKFNEYKTREGTKALGESMTDQSQREECDIYTCLKKYGISTLVNKTKATEFLYLDNTNRNMSLDEAVRMRRDMEDYFKQQPARVRKQFNDNVDMFIEKYKKGDFTDFIATGVLNEELVEQMKGIFKNEELEENTISTESVPTDINQGNFGTVAGTDGSIRQEQS